VRKLLVILQILLVSALLLAPSTALAAGPAVRVDDPDDVTGRRLLDIKSATNQAEDWEGPSRTACSPSKRSSRSAKGTS
jgi:hypothetical protein